MQRDDKRPYHTSGQFGHGELERLRVLLDDSITFTSAYYRIQHHFRGRAAASTVEALMLGLREHGAAVLKEAPVLQRLDALSEAQLHDVCERLQKLKPEIPRAWTADEVRRLLEVWMGQHGR